MNNTLKGIFTYLIVLFPILSVYYSGIATLTIADIALIVLIPILIFSLYKKQKIKNISLFFLIIIFYMILQLLIYYLLDKIDIDAIMTTLRLLLYYFVICIFIKDLFDIKLGIQFYKKIAVISSAFYIFQFICLKFFNTFIQGTLPIFKTTVDNYNLIMSEHAWTSAAYARPRSFFTEPSHFAIYVALCLAMLLLKRDKKDIKYIVIITLAMLLSGSGMAIILAIIIYGYIIALNVRKINAKKIVILIFIIALCMPVMFFYTKSDSFKIFYNRTFIEQDSTEGRFGNFIQAFTKKKDSATMIFGEGVYKIADVEGQQYITSIPRVYTYFGILGLMFFLMFMIYYLIKLKGVNKLSLLILLAISFAGEILFHNMIFTYIPYILCNERNEKHEK